MAASIYTPKNLNYTGALPTPAHKQVETGVTHGSCSADQTIIINLLNQVLASEIACVFRYRRHHFIARDIQATDLAKEFLLDAKEKLEHAHKIAERITQLGGKSELGQKMLIDNCSIEKLADPSAVEMITANLAAERITIDHHLDLIQRIDGSDAITGNVLKTILAEAEVQAGALAHLLTLSASTGLQPAQSTYAQ